ncbi:hypothetical protein PSPO01_03220 [Paraphaeosphaeria sporulosa]
MQGADGLAVEPTTARRPFQRVLDARLQAHLAAESAVLAPAAGEAVDCSLRACASRALFAAFAFTLAQRLHPQLCVPHCAPPTRQSSQTPDHAASYVPPPSPAFFQRLSA